MAPVKVIERVGHLVAQVVNVLGKEARGHQVGGEDVAAEAGRGGEEHAVEVRIETSVAVDQQVS